MVLVFDYDGTLHNTARLYGCAFRAAYDKLVKNGFAEPHFYSDKYMSKYLGMTAQQMWDEFMPQLPENVKKSVSLDVGNEMVRQVFSGGAKLYDKAEQLLDRCVNIGCKMVILSNCHHDYLDAHRRYFDLDRWFVGYYCAEDYHNMPKERIFEFIKSDFPDNDYIVIGDRKSDIITVVVNNIPTVGCAYGFGSDKELKESSVIVNSIDRIYDAVIRIINIPK